MVLLLLLAAAAGAGTLVAGSREPLALRCALGLAVWGEALFLLAACGWLRPVPIVALLLVAVGGGAMRMRSWPRVSLLPALAVVAIGVPAFLLALHPPLAFDETLYHLPFVRDLAETGRLRFLGHLRFPVFPQLHELLCVPVYLLAGDAATHLMSLMEVAVTAGLAAAWARRYSVQAGPLAAALFIGSPIIVHLATILYVEAALTLFVVAGFYMLDVALGEARRGPLVLSGFFFGAACSVKYLGGFFAVAALLVVLVRRRRGVLLFASAVVAAALPTTLWIVLASGSPVFPFAPSLFGSNAWALPPEPVLSFFDALRVPWDVTFARQRMNAQPPVTPLLIPMLLAIAAAAMRSGRARVFLLLAAAYLALFTFLPRDTRYLVVFLPLFSVAAAVIVATRLPRWTTLAAAATGVAYLAWRLALLGLPPATPEARATELATRVPGYTALTRAGSSPVYVCGGEQLQAYARGPLLGDWAGLHPYARVLDGDGTLAERLRTRNVGYVLVVKARCTTSIDGLTLVHEDAGAQL
ncbi:MAG: hypothetical protein QOJ98_834, partial [Acidobacteriota bacterium]|nr:hypothetical protein [Acidobacteriota bacterium]